MHIKACLILYLVFCLGTSPLQAQTTFQKTYHSGQTFDFGQDIQLTSDGGYLIGGSTSAGQGPSDLYLLKLSAVGNIEWANAYGAAGNEDGFEVKQTADGGFIAIGNTDTRLAGGAWDILLLKTAANGQLQWAKVIGNEGIDEGRSVLQLADGAYLLSGRAGIAGGLQAFLLKLDAQGNMLWAKTYGLAGSNAVAESIKPSSDGGFIMVGAAVLHGNYDVFLVKTAADGSLLWAKTFGDSLMDMGYDVVETTDGGYVVTGTYGRQFTDSLSTTYYGDVFLFKTTALGDLQWAKTYGKIREFGTGHSLEQLEDGSLVVAGQRNGLYFLKTTATGDLLWSKKYGTLSGTDGSSSGISTVKKTPGGGFVLSGTVLNAATGFDIYLIKSDSSGMSGCRETDVATQVDNVGSLASGGAAQAHTFSINDLSTQITQAGLSTTLCFAAGQEKLHTNNNVRVFPNPASSQFTLENDEEFKQANMIMYNTSGQVVKSYYMLTGKRLHFERENLTAGLYYIQISEPKKLYTRIKLLLMD
jgi:hypothetical protein